MIGIPDELKYVPLSDAQVLEDVPGGVIDVGGVGVVMFGRKIGNGLLEGHMSIAADE
jgi:hypothetical protein